MDFLTMPFFASFNVTDQVSHTYKTTGKLRFCVFYSLYLRQKKEKQKILDRMVFGNSVNLLRC